MHAWQGQIKYRELSNSKVVVVAIKISHSKCLLEDLCININHKMNPIAEWSEIKYCGDKYRLHFAKSKGSLKRLK